MAPNAGELTSNVEVDPMKDSKQSEAPPKFEIIYFVLIYILYWHVAAFYGLYLCFTSAKWQTIALGFVFYTLSEFGITAGAHRLWSHRAYKAKMPLQILLMLFTSMNYQNHVIHWVRDHRLHHKYTDTNRDPHNPSRGFWYSHVGWVFTKKSKEVLESGKTIDMSDLLSNPVLRFQKKYSKLMFGFFTFTLPTVLPVILWGESLSNGWHINVLRYVLNLNFTWFVNSLAHLIGNRPYDKSMAPTQNILVSFLILGEGFHNYHHAFPWDYRTAELFNKPNVTTWVIDLFAKIGWAYDLKTASNSVIENRVKRTGDGTHSWALNDITETADNLKKSE